MVAVARRAARRERARARVSQTLPTELSLLSALTDFDAYGNRFYGDAPDLPAFHESH